MPMGNAYNKLHVRWSIVIAVYGPEYTNHDAGINLPVELNC